MNKWTPEPWVWVKTPTTDGFGGRYEQLTLRGNGGAVCVAYGYGAHSTSENIEISEGDQARIVACVNGCKGINPEAVPGLLAACKAARTTIECTLDDKEARGDAVNWEAANRIMETLRAAIADAERGAS